MKILGDFWPILDGINWLLPGGICVLGVCAIFYRIWWDRQRIVAEAESKDVELLSIRLCLWPFSPSPFDFVERMIPGCRLYRVRAQEPSGIDRTGYVLIGPRRWVSRWQSYESQSDEAYGTLTWRWEKHRHPKQY